MGFLLFILIVFVIVFILYLKHKEQNNKPKKTATRIASFKKSEERLKKIIDETDDKKSIEELEKNLKKLTDKLDNIHTDLEQLELNNQNNINESPYSPCNESIYYRFNNLTISLTYKDAKGKITNRNVDITSFDGYYIEGYCQMKKAYRTFLLERVLNFADINTGEIISDPCNYFKEKYVNSPDYALDIIFNNYKDLLRVLLYVVKVDGKYTEHEKIAIRKLVQSLNYTNIDLSDKLIDDLMKDIEIPSVHSFRIAVGKVIKIQSLPFNLINEIENIISADGKVDDAELATLNYIKKRIDKQ